MDEFTFFLNEYKARIIFLDLNQIKPTCQDYCKILNRFISAKPNETVVFTLNYSY